MKSIIKTPFPYVNRMKDKLLVSLSFGVFIFLFLITFQPFGIQNIQFNKVPFVLGYAGVTFSILFVSYTFYPKLSRNFDADKWTVQKMLIYSVSQIVLGAIFNWLYTITFGKEIMEQHSLWTFVFITFSVGIIPISLTILLLERFLSSKNKSEADKLSDHLNIESQEVSLELGIPQSKILIHLPNLLFIKADGNYVEIHTFENGNVKRHLIRCSLAKIKNQLEENPHIVHCHRSYMANVEHLLKVTGNARSYNLHLRHLNFSIPVSRSFPIETIKM
jgi:hypothetical protein